MSAPTCPPAYTHDRREVQWRRRGCWSKGTSAKMSVQFFKWHLGIEMTTLRLWDEMQKDGATSGDTQIGCEAPQAATLSALHKLWMHPNSFRWCLPLCVLHQYYQYLCVKSQELLKSILKMKEKMKAIEMQPGTVFFFKGMGFIWLLLSYPSLSRCSINHSFQD